MLTDLPDSGNRFRKVCACVCVHACVCVRYT